METQVGLKTTALTLFLNLFFHFLSAAALCDDFSLVDNIHTLMTIYKLSNTYCLHNIYTPFSREPHNIYTTYPHYLHTIYTISTHLVEVGEVVVLVQHLLCRSLGPGHRQRWCAGPHYHVLTSLGSFLT